MSIPSPKRLVASILVVSLSGFVAPAGAATGSATLTGTVLGADGTFTVSDLGAGTTRLALSTTDGSFAVATPVVLAPGQTRGVRVALKAKAENDDDKKKGGAVPPSDGGKGMGAMIAVLVGFVAAGAVAIGQSGDDGNNPAASPSNPD